MGNEGPGRPEWAPDATDHAGDASAAGPGHPGGEVSRNGWAPYAGVHGEAVPAIRPAARLTGWRPERAELRWVAVTVLALAAAGAAAGPLWIQLAPRLSFTVVKAGQVMANQSESEAFIAADGRYVVITLAIGVLAGVLAWLPRSSRGWLMPVALTAGGLAGAALTRLVGQSLTGHPTSQALAQVGATVFAPIRLRAGAAVAVEAFVAVLVYLIIAGFAPDDNLGRPGGAPGVAGGTGGAGPSPAPAPTPDPGHG